MLKNNHVDDFDLLEGQKDDIGEKRVKHETWIAVPLNRLTFRKRGMSKITI